jgi:hypothetical protein
MLDILHNHYINYIYMYLKTHICWHYIHTSTVYIYTRLLHRWLLWSPLQGLRLRPRGSPGVWSSLAGAAVEAHATRVALRPQRGLLAGDRLLAVLVALHLGNTTTRCSVTHMIHGAAIYGNIYIPSIYPSHVSINIPAPWTTIHLQSNRI